MPNVIAWLAVPVAASVTVNVTAVGVVAFVGVPLMMPVEAANDSPAGRVPDVTVHVSGVTPPVAASVCEYAVPTTALGKLVVETAIAASMVSVKPELDAVCGVVGVESVALNVSGVAEIVPVGVPLRTAPVKLSPVGIVPAVFAQVIGATPPVSVNVTE